METQRQFLPAESLRAVLGHTIMAPAASPLPQRPGMLPDCWSSVYVEFEQVGRAYSLTMVLGLAGRQYRKAVISLVNSINRVTFHGKLMK